MKSAIFKIYRKCVKCGGVCNWDFFVSIESQYIKYDLTPIFRQNLISLMWNKDEKKRSNSGTKFVPFNIYFVHRSL